MLRDIRSGVKIISFDVGFFICTGFCSCLFLFYVFVLFCFVVVFVVVGFFGFDVVFVCFFLYFFAGFFFFLSFLKFKSMKKNSERVAQHILSLTKGHCFESLCNLRRLPVCNCL